MTILTEAQEEYLRDHLGSAVDIDDAQTRYDRLGDLDTVIVEVLRRRMADLAATPAQFSVAGEYSQNTGENIKALQAKLTEFGVKAGGGMSVVKITKPARRLCR